MTDSDAQRLRGLEIAVEKVRRLRAMGSLCRQQAAYNGMNKWKLLAEAEYWEHLAEIELSAYFQECNVDSSTSSHDLAVVRKLLQSGDEVTLKPKVGPTRQTSGALQ